MSIVIQIENLWKEYHLGVIGHGTLTHDLESWWAKMRGKEDPNTILPALEGYAPKIEGDRFWALQDINIEIQKGEVLGIIGKNGAGKSTLLKILSRVTAPSRGCIKIKGRIASLLEVGTGFHPELTGRENIFLNGAILGMSKMEIRTKLDEIIQFSGVEQYLDTPVKRYSSGMRVRLAFAVAAHLDPEILIVDEVLAVGDAEFQKKAIGKMNNLSSGQGRTVIVVSHNMKSIEFLCSSTIIIENGKIDYIGTASNAISRYLDRGDISENLFNISSKLPGIAFKQFYIKTKSGNIDFNESIFFFIKVESHFKCDLDVRIPITNSYGSRVGTIRHILSINNGFTDINITLENHLLSLGTYTASLNIKMNNKWAANEQDAIKFTVIGGEQNRNFDFMIERLGSLGNIYNSHYTLNQLS